jgi:protochlorophyllide reductase
MSNDERILVMTGGTSGFGRRMVERILAERPEWSVILLARPSPRVDALRSVTGAGRLTIVDTDLASLASVAKGAASVATLVKDRPIDTVVLNAGVQLIEENLRSTDGFELTFAVNHLSHLLLAERLAPLIKTEGRLIFTSSEVHDPDAFCLIGIARATWQPLDELADPTRAQMHQPAGVERGEARYSASKLLNLLTARYIAKTERRFSTFAFNPSVVPGTDIARDRNIFQILGWKYLMSALAPILPGARSLGRSAGDLLWLATDAPAETLRGEYVNGRSAEPGSAESRDEAKMAAVMKISRAMIDSHLGNPGTTAATG